MEEDNGKKEESPQFDDILVIRKKKSEEPPPLPANDDSILEGSSEEETSRYDSVEINQKLKEVKRPKTNKKRLFFFGGMAAVASTMLLGTAILYFTFSIEEPNLAPVKVRKKKDSTPSIVKAYRNVKNKLEDLKKASAERGMKELAEIDETPASKAAEKAKAELPAAATSAEDNEKTEEAEMSAEDKEKAEKARKEEEEKAKNPYSAYDLLPADKFAKEFLRLFTGSQRGDALACLAGSFKARPADLAFHDEVRTYIQMALPDDVLKIYNDIDLKQGDSPAICFVLGNIYYSNRVWSDAAKSYSKVLSKRKDIPDLEEKTVFAKARSGSENEAYEEYEKFLVSKAVPENQRILQMLKLSMLFYSPAKMDELLKRSADFPDDSDSFRYYSLCRDAIFGTLKLSSFSDWDPYSFHDLKVIALLSEGREKDVLMMRVPPSEFPDIWRVFLQWRNGAESWKELAARLHEKSSLKGGDPLCKFATSLWLEEKSPEALLKEVFLIEPEKYPLVCFFLSEYYRKNGEKALSVEYARKAFSDNGNIYKSMVEHYSKVK